MNQESTIDPIQRNRLKNIAVFIQSFPDAIGLFFFSGWRASVLRSCTSLRIYVALQNKQNKIHMMLVIRKFSTEKRYPENMRGINITAFFIHCFGRREKNMYLIIVRVYEVCIRSHRGFSCNRFSVYR